MRILPKYQNCQNCQYVQNYQITKFNKCSPKFQCILPLPVWLTDIHQLSILTKSPKMQNWTILQTLPKSLTLSKSQKLTKFQISPKLQTVWKGGNRQIKVDLVCRKLFKDGLTLTFSAFCFPDVSSSRLSVLRVTAFKAHLWRFRASSFSLKCSPFHFHSQPHLLVTSSLPLSLSVFIFTFTFSFHFHSQPNLPNPSSIEPPKINLSPWDWSFPNKNEKDQNPMPVLKSLQNRTCHRIQGILLFLLFPDTFEHGRVIFLASPIVDEWEFLPYSRGRLFSCF